MLTYIITGDNLFVTEGMRTYISKRFKKLERFIRTDDIYAITIRAAKQAVGGRADKYRVDAQFKIGSRNYFAVAQHAELLPAIDEVKDEIVQEVTKDGARRRTLVNRGARKIKALVRSVRMPTRKKLNSVYSRALRKTS